MFDLFLNIVKNNFPYLVVVGGIVIIDTISGLIKAFRFNIYESNKAKKLFSKILIYFCVCCAFLLIEFMLINLNKETYNITKVICVAITLVELSSINENFEIIIGKNIISTIINFVIEKLKLIVNTGKDEKND